MSALGDPVRLAALRATNLLDAPAEKAFERLTRLASRVLHVPVVLVSLVDEDRQFFQACVGLPEPWASRRETPLSHSFCQHVVVSEEPLVIEDARDHPLVRDNLAISDLNVVAYAGIPLCSSDGQVLGSFCAIDSRPRRWTPEDIETLTDLAGSVMTEIELRWELAERTRLAERLRASLREKEVLLREIHHRVKNNLQIVFSLLNLQARTIRDPGALEAIRESQSRVHAMALVHETLYRTPTMALVDCAEYMKVLVTHLMRAYPSRDGGVDLYTDIAPVELGIDTAVNLGLIVNELVANALKHAFGAEGGGNEIRISLQPEDAGSLTLRVSDNGVGLPPASGGGLPSLGLKLVGMLVEQLGGTRGSGSGAGAEFWVRFPADPP